MPGPTSGTSLEASPVAPRAAAFAFGPGVHPAAAGVAGVVLGPDGRQGGAASAGGGAVGFMGSNPM